MNVTQWCSLSGCSHGGPMATYAYVRATFEYPIFGVLASLHIKLVYEVAANSVHCDGFGTMENRSCRRWPISRVATARTGTTVAL
eukprot:1487797-Pleurochrysis_carterae.AAC.4